VDTGAEPVWRWIEKDPWDLAIHCAEEVWRAKAQPHPEIAAYEAVIRATVRAPDRVYFDPRSTAMLQPEGGASGVVEALKRTIRKRAKDLVGALEP